MSRIADKIRSYVDDAFVSNHYGEWGILRIDQRRQIRELCDTCDMFEKTADELIRKKSELSPCDVCQFNPPSSFDGKPCAVCPAQPKMRKEDEGNERRNLF